MPNFVYTSPGTRVRNVYRDNNLLVVRRGAVFPDVCMGCGKPAWGNVLHHEFSEPRFWYVTVHPVLDFLAHFALRTRYHFDFPFCSVCPPDRLQLTKLRLDPHLGVFRGAPSSLLGSLPPIPPDVAEEKNRTWLQRNFRWFYR